MARVESSVSKYLYKVFPLVLREIPYIISLCYIVFTAAFYFGLELSILGYIGSCSVLTWLFLYKSIIGISPTSSQEEFLNTLVHEAKHVQSHICKYYHVKEDTEKAAYLIGYIIQKMHRVFRYMISTGTK